MNARGLYRPVLALSLGLCACGTEYSATATEGWVIDEQTNDPLPGTHVVAHWELVGGFPETHPIGTLMLMETVTDETGRFAFPAWGPTKSDGQMGLSSPVLVFFKPGYVPTGRSNRYLGQRPSPISTSQWSGKRVELRRLSGVPEVDVRAFGSVNTTLEFSVEDCLWQKIPRIVVALDRETRRFLAAGIQGSLYSIERLEGRSDACPNAARFFKPLVGE